MPSGSVSYIDHTADVKFRLSTSVFGDGVLDPQQKSTISSLVAVEVARLTSSARLIISRTYVQLTTAHRTATWRIRQGSSLTVMRSMTVSLDDLSMSELTSI